MKRRSLLSLAFLVFFLNGTTLLYAYGELVSSISKSEDAAEWLNQLYQKSGRSLPMDRSEESPAEVSQTPVLNPEPQEEISDQNPEGQNWKLRSMETTPLQGERVKVSGHYRLAAGGSPQDFIVNDSNSDLQDRDSHFLYG